MPVGPVSREDSNMLQWNVPSSIPAGGGKLSNCERDSKLHTAFHFFLPIVLI